MKNTGIIILLASVLISSTHFAGANSINLSFSKSDSLPGNILVINAFDVMSAKVRKNKKELFMQLADSLKQIIYAASPAPNGKMIAIPELIMDTSDSNIHSLMVQNNAAKAIVIKTVNVYFDQTGVEVTKDATGKNRVASFDICSFVTYRLYNIGEIAIDSEMGTREFFTHRNVMSGLLAAGPDIVGKKKHAFEAIRKNGLEYLAKEKPWQ